MKRAFDFLVSLCALLVLSPIILIVALLVRRYLGTPVLFKQQRPGLNERPFLLYKFRTMNDARDVSGELLPDARRLTRVGKMIRQLSLDELPQLLNVLKGDMSLVGPRPLLMEYLQLYSAQQHRRHLVRPGITGWAQINGRNAIGWEERFALDVWYVDNHNFILDIKILLATVMKVMRRSGISQPGQETMSKFTGTSNKHE